MIPHRFAAFVRLGLVMCVTAVTWLIVLPWIAARPRVAAHLLELEEQGVDASAMFYTELEAMEPILHRLERR